MDIEHPSPPEHLLLVSSAKGGVGKTTVAVNLALALRELGGKVGLFDADLYGPDVPEMLGLRRTKPATAWVAGARAQTTPTISPVERYGLRVMSIGFLVGSANAVAPDPMFAGRLMLQLFRDTKWGELDWLIVDLPPGTGEPQTTLIRGLSEPRAILVTTPQQLAVLDTGRAVDHLRQLSVPILGVVHNMAYFACPHCGERTRVFAEARGQLESPLAAIPVLAAMPLLPDQASARGRAAGAGADEPDSLWLGLARSIVSAI